MDINDIKEFEARIEADRNKMKPTQFDFLTAILGLEKATMGLETAFDALGDDQKQIEHVVAGLIARLLMGPFAKMSGATIVPVSKSGVPFEGFDSNTPLSEMN